MNVKKHPNDLPDRSFNFAVEIINFCKTIDKSSIVNQPLVKQLLRSGTSIGANVHEGQTSQSKADFIHKYAIALKEARETLYWLKLFSAAQITSINNLPSLIKESDELVAILTTIVKKLRNQ